MACPPAPPSSTGIWEVLKHYSWFKQQFDQMLEEIVTLKPDALILIDYPGFNLRMAKAVREKLPNTKIIYYKGESNRKI